MGDSVQGASVQFRVLGDKKHQVGIEIELWDAKNRRVANGAYPKKDDDSGFWPEGVTHVVPFNFSTQIETTDLNGGRLIIRSHADDQGSSEWHTTVTLIVNQSYHPLKSNTSPEGNDGYTVGFNNNPHQSNWGRDVPEHEFLLNVF